MPADEPQGPSAEARIDERGRIRPGHTLNPGGESKLIREAKDLLRQSALDGAKLLGRIIRGEEKETKYVKDVGEVELPVAPKDLIAAVKVTFDYVLAKPKPEEDAQADKKSRRLAEVKEELLGEIAKLDS